MTPPVGEEVEPPGQENAADGLQGPSWYYYYYSQISSSFPTLISYYIPYCIISTPYVLYIYTYVYIA